MTETTLPLALERTEVARALSQSTDSGPAGLAGALLELVDRMGALFSVKEVATGRYLHANARMAELFGLTPSTMRGFTDSELMDAGQAASVRAAEQAAAAQATVTMSEHRIDRDGVRHEFSVARLAVERNDGAPARHVIGVWLDQTADHQREHQLQRALAQLEQHQIAAQAARQEAADPGLRDGTNGLYQREQFDDQLRREVDLSSREHREFALVSIVLDAPGDSVRELGSGARTRVLDALGRLLRGNTRAMDASCRLGEDRFAILLSGVGLATAHSRMEGLRRQCATQIVVLDGRDLGFTVSMGVASFPHTAQTEAELMQASDQALGEARRRGGNHVALASIRFELGTG